MSLPLWIADQENQNKFLIKLLEDIEEKNGYISEEIREMLSHVQSSLRLWNNTLTSDRSVFHKQRRHSVFEHMALSCLKKRCSCCQEYDSLEEELESIIKH